MAMNTVINTNMRALTAHRNLSTVGARQNKANQRLSSGKKINSAADDAAGLAISEKMKAQIKGLDMASKNSEDAISLIQTAEGSLTEVNNMLTRVRELTVQAANDTNQQEDRVKIAEEVASLLTEIDSISSRTEFNEKKLNDGSFQDGFFQIGANAGQKLDLGIGNMSVFGIGMDEIMDTFGLEKKVDLDPKSDVKGVVVPDSVAKTTSSFTVAALTGQGTSDLTTATITMKIEVKGQNQELKLNLDLSAVKANASETTLAAEIANQLNKNEDFSKYFKATSAAGKVSFEALDVGGEVTVGQGTGAAGDIAITYGKDSAANNVAGGNLTYAAANSTKGSYGTIDIDKLQVGEKFTIAGKTFTKVEAGNPDKVPGGFNTRDELTAILKADGVSASNGAGAGEIILNYAEDRSSLSGTYSVSSKDVSDKGKEFSNLLDSIDESLKTVTTQRSKLGANQNRLEYTINNLNITSENLSAAKSRIEDTDMAKEMMNLTSANVLQQAATSMLAQANQAPQSITQLLG